MVEEELFPLEDIFVLALRLREFHKKLNQVPVKWCLGRLEREQLLESMSYSFPVQPQGPVTDYLFGIPIEWVDTPSEMGLIVAEPHQPLMGAPLSRL